MKWIVLVGLCLVVRRSGQQATWWNRHAASISCSAPGYFVNLADCRSFYRCVDRSTWDKPSLQRYDFTCPDGQVFDQAVSVCTKPGSNGCADPWWNGRGGGGKGSPSGGSVGGETSAATVTGGENGLDLDSLPPIFGSSRGPTTKPPSGGGGALFGARRPASGGSGFRPSMGVGFGGGGGGGDPLDAEFGSDGKTPGPFEGGNGNDDGNNVGFNKPVGAEISFGGGRPSFGGGGGGSDPLDNEFGTPSDSGNSGSGSLEDLNLSGERKGEARHCPMGSCATTTNRTPTPSWFNRPSPSKKPNWDRNDGPSSTSTEGFDPWSNNQLGSGPSNNRPRPSSSGANWGSSPRPGFGDGGGNPFSPWRPTGPWGASSNKPLDPPDDRSDSWWDPPFALPFHTATAAPPPPPEPWGNPFHRRYPPHPAYQLLAYPTWPGPYQSRNHPIIVVYSNSKK